MEKLAGKLERSHRLAQEVNKVFRNKVKAAHEHFLEQVQRSFRDQAGSLLNEVRNPWDVWSGYQKYAADFVQRCVLFLDVLRERGDQYLDHVRAGMPPVLHFKYEMVADGRTFERPVNYALVKIIAPAGVETGVTRRPYIIIDPRAGHGPGIGGFKDDSQVGVALRDGHPVYFVIFFPEPEPNQTLLDVCAAELEFVHRVRALHPDSPKPVIVGNCQGGWAAMMLAAANPDETGPIVINGAPMSYWGGAWRHGESDNPMRYAGGLLGGTWMASLATDLGGGLFDGAHLVSNFENLNPANTFWTKYYHLFANVDTERDRFLNFERWWGGFFLMNRDEIEWIVENLFVGNRLASGKIEGSAGKFLDLKSVQSPIILFASLGDNITPPQQAFNWVADTYSSTEELKAMGRTIVGLLHEDIGHLGIFVSGRVAKREHKEIVSVMKSIEALPPGLFGMRIKDRETADGGDGYEVEFIEHRIEDVVNKLNRYERDDEQAFEAVAEISQFNQQAYELFVQPFVETLSNGFSGRVNRAWHPKRVERWAFSDMNPWMLWVKHAANAVRAGRSEASSDQPFRRAERVVSDLIVASLDYYRDVRDALSESLFFMVYGNIFSMYMADRIRPSAKAVTEPGKLPLVQDALKRVGEGGFNEAFARVTYLLSVWDQPITLERLQMRQQLAGDYAGLMPVIPEERWKPMRGEQELICRYAPEAALATLPQLLTNSEDRNRLLTLLDRLQEDERVKEIGVTSRQRAMLKRIREVLSMQETEGRSGATRVQPVVHSTKV